MNPSFRHDIENTLVSLVDEFGAMLLDEPGRLMSMLLDLRCDRGHRPWIYLLVEAVRLGLVRVRGKGDAGVVYPVRHLVADWRMKRSVDEKDARWALEVWKNVLTGEGRPRSSPSVLSPTVETDGRRGRPRGPAVAGAPPSTSSPVRWSRVQHYTGDSPSRFAWGMPDTNVAGGDVRQVLFHPSEPETLWVGTFGGGVFRTSDSGVTWLPGLLPVEGCFVNDLAVHAAEPERLLVATEGGLFSRQPLEEGWQQLLDFDVNCLCFAPADPDRLYVASPTEGVLVNHDGGLEWVPAAPLPGVSRVHRLYAAPGDAESIYAACEGGLFVTRDRGATWEPLLTSWDGRNRVDCRFVNTAPSGSHTLVCGLAGAGLLLSLDRGLSWNTLPGPAGPGSSAMPVGLEFDLSTPGAYYVAFDTQLLRCSGEEQVRERVYPPKSTIEATAPMLTSLKVSPLLPGTIALGVRGGGLFRSRDAANSWEALSNGLDAATVSCLAASPIEPGFLIAGTLGAGLCATHDGGVNWTPFCVGLDCASVLSVAFDSGGSWLYAVVAGADLMRLSSDGSGGFDALNQGLPAGATPLGVAADSRRSGWVLAVLSEGLFVSRDSGQHWCSAALGDPTHVALAPTRSGRCVGCQADAILLSDDFGSSFRQVARVGRNEAPIQCLHFSARTPDRLYIGCDDGLLVYTAASEHWSLAPLGLSGSKINWIADVPSRPGLLFAGATDEGCFVTADEGRTWLEANEGLTNRFTTCGLLERRAGVLCVGTLGGGVFRQSVG